MSSSLSNYAIRMARLSARIFGEVARPTDASSMKVVKLLSEQPYAKRKEIYDWYPPHNVYYGLMRKLRFYGLYSPVSYYDSLASNLDILFEDGTINDSEEEEPDEHEDFKEEMKRLKKLRGKGPPKKGEGKRALKRKA